jgi:hypothetical protein
MPKKNAMRKSRRKAAGGDSALGTKAISLMGPALTTNAYNGPVHRMPTRAMPESSVQVLNFETDVTTSGAGLYTVSVSTGSSGGTFTLNGSALEWGSFSAQFSDYRVLGLRMEFFPAVQGAAAPANLLPKVWQTATDMDDATAAATAADLVSFNTLVIYPNNKQWHREVTMSGRPGEADLIPISNQFTRFQSIKAITVGNTASVYIGRLKLWWRVQFFHRE